MQKTTEAAIMQFIKNCQLKETLQVDNTPPKQILEDLLIDKAKFITWTLDVNDWEGYRFKTEHKEFGLFQLKGNWFTGECVLQKIANRNGSNLKINK
jgi:hypothetical protein